MKHACKHLLAAGLLATLAFASTAQTQPATPAAAPAASAREHHGRFDSARMQERIVKRQAALKHKLQITPAQEGAWASYIAAMKPPADAKLPQRGELEKLTTPERIDRMREIRNAHMAEMDKRGEATKALYAVLSADQKKVFDAETAPRGRHMHHHDGPGHHRS
jgi:periplasmic protein CpxP/Spy